MACIDYKKAFDTIPETWIKEWHYDMYRLQKGIWHDPKKMDKRMALWQV